MRLWIDTGAGDDPDATLAVRCAEHARDADLAGVSTVAAVPPPELVAPVDALVALGPWTNIAELATKDALPRRVVLMGGALGGGVERNVGADPRAAAQLLATVGNLIVVPLEATTHVDRRAPIGVLIALGEPIARMETRRLEVEPSGVMRASIRGPLQHVVAHVDARTAQARVRALTQR